MFGRRRHVEAEPDEPDEIRDEQEELAEDEESDEIEDDYEPSEPVERPTGPWALEDVETPGEGRVDFGGLFVPAVDGMEMRVQVADNQVIEVTVILAQTAVALAAFAAPRTEGIWADVRDELRGEIAKQGGIVDEVDGPFGPELRAQVPVAMPDGNRGVQVMRFLGCDGPRWMLRGVITGQGAVDPRAAAGVEEVYRQTVVNRGTQAMAPRDAIPLQLPPEMREQQAEQPVPGEPGRFSGGIDPFDRGPEITEVR